MIQELLRKYKKAKAEWAKGNIKATPQTVEPSGKGQRPRLHLARSLTDTAFSFREVVGTANWSALLITLLPKLNQVELLCLYTGWLGCPSAGHWQAKDIGWQHPHEFYQGKSKVLHVGENSPMQQFRLGTDRPGSTLWEMKVGVWRTRIWTWVSSVLMQQWVLTADWSALAKA